MSLEIWTTIASVGTLLVIAATAVAAITQLRLLRATTQLDGFLSLVREYHSDEIQRAREFVARELSAKLQDEQYRDDISSLQANVRNHPELLLREFWEKVGALIRHGVLDTPLFLEFFTVPCLADWDHLASVNELMRKENPYMSEEFEFIATLCDKFLQSRRQGAPPTAQVKPPHS